MNLEVYRDALSARPHRARGAAHRHPAALVLQHVVHRALHVATLAGAGIHLSSHHAALVYGGAPLVRRTVDALARRGNRDRAPDRSVTHHGTATAQGGVTSGAPSGRAVVRHLDRDARHERLVNHAVAPRQLEQLLPFVRSRIGVYRETHADALEPHGHVLRHAEGAAEVQIAFG